MRFVPIYLGRFGFGLKLIELNFIKIVRTVFGVIDKFG